MGGIFEFRLLISAKNLVWYTGIQLASPVLRIDLVAYSDMLQSLDAKTLIVCIDGGWRVGRKKQQRDCNTQLFDQIRSVGKAR